MDAALRLSPRHEAGRFRSVPGQADGTMLLGVQATWRIGYGVPEPDYWRARMGEPSASSAASGCCEIPIASGRNTWWISPSADRDMG
jgi:hypothetical protein